jgi:hypothetical protein
MVLYSNQSKYFLTAGINLKKEIGLFPLELDRLFKDSTSINDWKEVNLIYSIFYYFNKNKPKR